MLVTEVTEIITFIIFCIQFRSYGFSVLPGFSKVLSRQIDVGNRQILTATSVAPTVHSIQHAFWIAFRPRTRRNKYLYIKSQ